MAEKVEHKKSGECLSEQEMLIKVAQTANSTRGLKEILDQITALVADGLKKNVCSIYRIRPDKKTICLERVFGILHCSFRKHSHAFRCQIIFQYR